VGKSGFSAQAERQIKIINLKMLSTHKQKKLNWPGHLGQVPKNNNKGERQKTNVKTGK